MNEVKKTGKIAKKNFKNTNFILIEDSSNQGEYYYFYKLDVENNFPVGKSVIYILANFTDGNRPIVIDVQ